MIKKEFDPSEQNQVDLERSILDLKKKKSKFVEKKIKKQLKASELKDILNNPHLEKEDYTNAIDKRIKVKNSLSELEGLIIEINIEIGTKRKLLIAVSDHLRGKKQIGVSEDGTLKKIAIIKEKYSQFAADNTRVSSMRIMAAKFVRELSAV